MSEGDGVSDVCLLLDLQSELLFSLITQLALDMLVLWQPLKEVTSNVFFIYWEVVTCRAICPAGVWDCALCPACPTSPLHSALH